MFEILLLMVLAVVVAISYIFCKENYLLDADTAGTVVADAQFLTDLTGKAVKQNAPGYSGYPNIHAALGVEAIQVGLADVPARGFVNLTELNNDNIDINYDIWQFPTPFYSALADVTAGDLQYIRQDMVHEPFNKHKLNMPYPEGSTLTDGTTSKIFASVTSTYQAWVLYMLGGKKAPKPRGGPVHTVTYDKGGDSTTLEWNILENAAQNAAGELKPTHKYRLLWGAFDSQAVADGEALLGRVTVPNHPPLTFPGAGTIFNSVGIRRVYFIDDSIVMDGDAVHKVEGQIGIANQPLVHLGWEDMGKGRV